MHTIILGMDTSCNFEKTQPHPMAQGHLIRANIRATSTCCLARCEALTCCAPSLLCH